MLRWCVLRHDGRPILGTEALMLSNIVKKVTHILRRDSFSATIVLSERNFIPAFEKEYDLSFLGAEREDIVEDMVSFDLQYHSDNSAQYSTGLIPPSTPLYSHHYEKY